MNKKAIIVILAVISSVFCGLGLTACNLGKEEYSLSADKSYYIYSKGDRWTEQAAIRERFNGKPVCEIGEGAFRHCTKLKKIKIPDSVTKIGANAFNGCRKL